MSRWLSAAAALSVVALAAGCGSSTPAATTSPTMTMSMTAAQTAACDALLKAPADIFSYSLAINTEPAPDVATKNRLLTTMADDLTTIAAGTTGSDAAVAASVAATMKEAVRTKNYAVLEDDAFFGKLFAYTGAGRTVCGLTGPQLMAMEHPAAKAGELPKYEFMDMPTTFPAGKTSIAFEDKGKSPHELLVFKLKDSFTGGTEEIKKMTDAQMGSIAAGLPVQTAAAPGTTAYLNVDLTPGRYVFFCHIPLTDQSGAPLDKTGKPTQNPANFIWHFDIGMLYIATVS